MDDNARYIPTLRIAAGETSTRELPVEALRRPNDGAVLWVPLRNPEPALLTEVARRLDLHPLTIEDLLSPTENDKLEEYPSYLFGSIRRARLSDGDELLSDTLLFVFFHGLILTVSYGESPVLVDRVTRQLDSGVGYRAQRSSQAQYDAGYLLYLILRASVQSYRETADTLATTLDGVENRVTDMKPVDCSNALAPLRRAMVALRRNASTCRLVVNQLEREDDTFLPDDFDPYLRDLSDQLSEIVQLCESERDVITSLQELNMAFHNTRMNETMKVLTIIATIFMPLSFVAAVYGMNFRYMPELSVPWAYPAVIGGMLVLAGLLLLFFKRKGWF